MPSKPLKPCRFQGCPELTRNGYCDKHRRQESRRYERQRGTPTERGYDNRWKKARVTFLKEHPLCVECGKEGKLTPATVVDHIVPHKGDMVLFWDKSNWQSLCKKCHDRKTAKEDGGFGRKRG